jgi:hypothetical protein
MANKIRATVLIVLPDKRLPLINESPEDTKCKCGRKARAVKMTFGKVDRPLCVICLDEYVDHYVQSYEDFHLYGVNA